MNFTPQQIADEQKIVLNDLYTVADIMKGDTIAMNAEARKIALLNLQDRAEGHFDDHDCDYDLDLYSKRFDCEV